MKIVEGTIFASDGFSLYARSWLPEKKPTALICLVHGLGEHCQRYDHVGDYFTKSGFALFSMDLRGHGKTLGPRGHIPSYGQAMADISSLISSAQKQFPEKPVFLYGHSMGGNLVLYYAIQMQPTINGLIVSAPGLGPANPPSGFTLALGKIMYKILPSFALNNGLDLQGLSRDTNVVQKYQNDPLVHPMVSARLGLDIINNGKYIIDHGGEINIPILLYQGQADRLVDPKKTQALSKMIKPSLLTYKEFPGFFHELHNEPEQNKILKEYSVFIESHI